MEQRLQGSFRTNKYPGSRSASLRPLQPPSRLLNSQTPSQSAIFVPHHIPVVKLQLVIPVMETPVRGLPLPSLEPLICDSELSDSFMTGFPHCPELCGPKPNRAALPQAPLSPPAPRRHSEPRRSDLFNGTFQNPVIELRVAEHEYFDTESGFDFLETLNGDMQLGRFEGSALPAAAPGKEGKSATSQLVEPAGSCCWLVELGLPVGKIAGGGYQGCSGMMGSGCIKLEGIRVQPVVGRRTVSVRPGDVGWGRAANGCQGQEFSPRLEEVRRAPPHTVQRSSPPCSSLVFVSAFVSAGATRRNTC